MRRLILAGLLGFMVLPAGAAKRVTVAQLEQSLATDTADHRLDADIARRLGDVELTERITDSTLAHLAKSFTMGPRTALALQLVADQSAFLDPPPSELPATGSPDAPTQARMMDMARGYVVQTWPHLPDFFFTRTTYRFDDSPQVLEKGNWPVRIGMHLVGSTTRDLTYRDGVEVQDSVVDTAATKSPATPQQARNELGLFSFGEFGPELTVILTDAARGKVTFSHWEQTAAGLAAVYRYSVPKAASHYEVQYCCLREAAPSQRRELAYAGRDRVQPAGVAIAPANAVPFRATPGYHGSLFIDPATGAILRITLEAELKQEDPITRAATVVQYGHVMIGDRSYICPVRSLAFSMEQASPSANGEPTGAPNLLVNETSFSHYRRLAAKMRIITDATEPGSSNPAPPASSPQPSANSASASPAAPSSGESTQPPAPALANNTPPSPPPTEAPAPPPPPAEPAVPEMSITAANGVPDEPSSASPSQSSYQLKLTSRLVDVGVVAYDKKGRPVKDLKTEDFEVYDNGHKQDVRFFSQFATEPSPASADNGPVLSYANRSVDAGPAETTPAGATILLIDESHIAWPDMSHARQEILKFLATVAPGERVGLYTMTALGFRVLQEITTDHAALTAKLQKWTPDARSAALAQEEETRNRQSFNEVHSTADLNSVNGNEVEVPDAQQTVDPVLRTMGANPARASLIILRMIARHLSAVSGHKNLVWVSSDNVFADWQSNQVAIDKTPKVVDSFAMHAQEAMNDAHVAVFPMDVSQLESSAINADIRTRNVELTQAAADMAAQNGGQVATNLNPGRNTAEMQQDMHPIQGPIRMVADATGGRIIRRAGDLAGAIAGVVEDGHATYLVSFYPQGPADDQYHTITVKLVGKQRGLTLRYRTGYLYTKEPATLKDRFQQAVWRPLDVSEISVTADLGAADTGSKIKLSILASDLGLQQQADRWMDKLDIFFIQRDDAGIRAQVEGQTLGLRLKSSTYQNLMATGIPFNHVVQMKPGMASLRVLVVDENSGRMGSVTIPAPALGGSQ